MTFDRTRYDRRSSPRRSVLGHYVPFFLLTTVATVGLAAWVWSERQDHDDDSSDTGSDFNYGEGSSKGPPPYTGSEHGVIGPEGSRDDGLVARVAGAIQRTPSPQHLYDQASKRVVAGVAAASAMVGGALGTVREEREDFADHSRWTEEAVLRRNVAAQSAQSTGAVAAHADAFSASVRDAAIGKSRDQPMGRRKTVALVVSADSSHEFQEDQGGNYHSEHATLLSHLPPVDTRYINLLILIYAPSIKSRSEHGERPTSLGSSYSALSTPAHTPGEELSHMDPHPLTPALSARSSGSELYESIYSQALKLVDRDVSIMPFSTPSGHVHMLKHIAPDVVYMVEGLSGSHGENVEQVKGWVGQIVLIVGGDGAGLGGLVDTEDEGEGGKASEKAPKWWESSDMVGFGKGVEVVDGVRMTEDWQRRVAGRD